MNQSIPLPTKIYFVQDEKFKSKLVVEPLYPGYGMTIGNSLRRVLLSSLPGAAVTAVKIKGVDHEFSTIPNIVDDVVDVVLNLKQLRLKLHSDEPVKLLLNAKGQKEATAANIKPDSRVEIVNPDLMIATLDNKNAELSMEITVEQGRGYVPVEMRENQNLEIGTIAIDAIFTPIRNVNFEVENVRVGQMTNYDKLTITIETDGTISGREAVDIASSILVGHFDLFKTSHTEQETKEGVAPEEVELKLEDDRGKFLDEAAETTGLEGLDLSSRASNALMRNNVRTVSQLRGMTREELMGLKGLGAKSVDEILHVLDKSDVS